MRYILLLYAILFSGLMLGQKPNMRHFGVDEGLPSSNIYTLYQDTKGFLWIATDKGVARYDGYRFETFSTKDGLPNNDIWGIVEAQNQRIWFKTYLTDFAYYDYFDNQFHTLPNPMKNFHNELTASIFNVNGQIWYTCSEGMIEVNPPNKVHKYKAGFWATASNIHFPPFYTPFEKPDLVFDIQGKWIHQLQTHSSNINNLALWGGEKNFLYYNKDTLYFDTPQKRSFLAVSSLSSDKSIKIERVSLTNFNGNYVLILTNKGSFVLNQNLEHLSNFDFLNEYDIQSFMEDKEGNIWIISAGNGLFMLTRDALRSALFQVNAEMGENLSITDVVKDNHGRVWVGTTNGDVGYFEKDKYYSIQFLHPPQGALRSLFLTNHQTLFLIFNNATYYFPTNKIALELKCNAEVVTLMKDPEIPTQYLSKDKEGIFQVIYKKISSLNGENTGISKVGYFFTFQETEKGFIFFEKAIPVRNYGMVQDKAENIWLATPQGLKIIKGNILDTLTLLKKDYPLLKSPITSIGIDSRQRIWVATDGYGLFYLDSTQQNRISTHSFSPQPIFTPISELAGSIIKSLFVDKKDKIWVSTNQGAFRVTMNDKGKPQVFRYSIAQGLPTNEVANVWADSTSAWIATAKGLVRIHQSTAEKYTDNKPLLYLRQVVINGEPFAPVSNVVFSYLQNNIQIEYVCLSFRSDKNIRYYYRMLSENQQDTSWNITIDLKKEFPLLNPGKYLFQIKAEDVDGIQTEIKEYAFQITPPWWDTTVFKLLVLSGLLSLLGLIVYLRIRFVRNQEKGKNEFAEMRLQMLQAQMNPHFTNNALLAIQSFVMRADHQKAQEYLAKFAELNRLYLEASRMRFTSLKQEIELLRYYLELEHLRFADKFDYEIKVSEKDLQGITEFPAMLLQPLAENAINHGLLYLKRKGNLTIRVSKENHKVVAVVEDDGIGRKAAQEIKNRLKKTHISRAGQIMKDIQSTLNTSGKIQMEIQTIDKMNAQGNSLGTCVNIILTYLKL